MRPNKHKAPSILNLTEMQKQAISLKLEIWSEYIINNHSGYAVEGFSSCVPWARLTLRNNSYSSRILMPVTYDEYRLINNLIIQLSEVEQDVIRLEWCFSIPRPDKAKMAGIDEKTFRKRLDRAYTSLYLLGILSRGADICPGNERKLLHFAKLSRNES